jgi:U3 small nucleolar RNA-associated protein 10
MGLLQNLISIISSPLSEGQESVNKQTALLSLEILVRAFARVANESQARLLLDALKAVVACLESSAEEQVISSSLLCLATFCAEMGLAILESLPKFMPIVLRLLQTSSSAAEPASHELELLVQVSALSSLEVVVINLNKLLTPYLSQLLGAILCPTLIGSAKTQIVTKVTNILHLLATHIQMRVLLPASMQSFAVGSSGTRTWRF